MKYHLYLLLLLFALFHVFVLLFLLVLFLLVFVCVVLNVLVHIFLFVVCLKLLLFSCVALSVWWGPREQSRLSDANAEEKEETEVPPAFLSYSRETLYVRFSSGCSPPPNVVLPQPPKLSWEGEKMLGRMGTVPTGFWPKTHCLSTLLPRSRWKL